MNNHVMLILGALVAATVNFNDQNAVITGL